MGKKTKSPVAQPAKAAVLVLGMHRSGTSALAGVLSKLGCALPKAIMEPSRANAKGFFESTAVRDLNDEILASGGSSWDDFLAFNPNWKNSPVATTYFERAVELVRTDFGDNPLIVLKDPRISRLVPFWKDVLEAADFRVLPILTVRHPEEVARSLRQKKKFSRGLSHMIWLHHVLEAEQETRGMARYVTSYDLLIRRWPLVLSEAARALDVYWPRGLEQVETVIEDFLSTELRHHQEHPDDQGDNPLLVAWLRNTYAIFSRWAEQGEDSDDYDTLDTIRDSFSDAARAFGRLVKVEREERQSLGDQIKTLEAAREAERQRAADAVERSETDARKLSELRDELTARRSEKEILTKKLLAEREEAQANERALADALAASEARAQEIAQLSEALRSEKQRATASERDMAALVSEHKTLTDQFEAQRTDLEKLKKSASARDQELAQLTLVITQGDREITRLGKELTEAEAAREASAGELDALRNELSQLQSALLQRQHEAETTAAELKQVKAELTKTRVELTEALDRHSREADASARLRTDLEAARKSSQEVQEHLQDRFREIAKLTQYAMKQQGEISSLQSQVGSLNKKTAAGESANALLIRDSAQRVSEMAELHMELSNLRYDLTTAQRDLSRTQHQRDSFAREVSDLRSSTSWRITGPFRRMIRLVRRR